MIRPVVMIVSCSDWIEPCYDEQPPAPRIDVSSLLADVEYLTACAVLLPVVVRLVAGVIGAVVVLRVAHGSRPAVTARVEGYEGIL